MLTVLKILHYTFNLDLLVLSCFEYRIFQLYDCPSEIFTEI